MTGMTMASQTETDLSKQVVGEQLSGVTFVMDYLQLQFNPPPTINAYTAVTVFSNGKSFVSGDDQFRNRLCEQITKIVKSVVIRSEEGFLITFEDGSVISISLKPSDYVGPEALEFRGRDNLWVVI
jgi:hypothetical protein